MRFSIFDSSSPEKLELIISSSEWGYAQRLVLPLLPGQYEKSWDGENNVLLFSVDTMPSIKAAKLLAFIGKLEAYHAQFLLRVIQDKQCWFEGGPKSASRFLRRPYKRLTPLGRIDRDAYVCDEKEDKEIGLCYLSELKLLCINAGPKYDLLVGPENVNLQELNKHFAIFGISVDISK